MKTFYLIAATYFAVVFLFMGYQRLPEANTQVRLSPYLVCQRETYASEVHCLTNQHRQDNQMHLLHYSPQAEQIAKKRAEHLCTTNTWTHDGWVDFLDIEYRKAGENLTHYFNAPDKAVKGLLSSPLHKKNIEGDWDSMGVWTEPCGTRNVSVQIFIKE